ncbi:MAG: hypothetical protein COT37_00525 [Parcubacteria group bacterium CG08_land_8_20_14_0_20_43_9]|nr:MAG: hypothetical protein COT37_00525 [Parcubacteria group bacterium CG08_land_8_20_14_0_20_43_9]
MIEGLDQAKKLLDASKRVLILTPQNPGVDSFASAVSLSYTLNNKGKVVNLHPRNIPQNYAPLFPKPTNPSRFVITVRGKEISELYYEKENQILKIFLSPKDNKINKDDINFDDFQELPETESDLLITIGVENLEKLGNFYEKNFKLFYQTPILNIDNQITNSRFGNVNLIAGNLPMALISNRLIELLQDPTDSNTKTWILAGIIAFSRDKEINQEITSSVFGLISSNIHYKELLKFFAKDKDSRQLKLLETALRKIEFRREKQLPIICLTKKDFQESGARPKDLGFILKELTGNILQLPTLLLLWENENRQNPVMGVFYSPKPYSSGKILETFDGETKGKGIIFKTENGNMNDVKEKVMEVIF